MLYRVGYLIVALQAVLVLLITIGTPPAYALDSERWPALKQNYFAGRSIVTDSQVISLEAPKRAHDAATVPVVIKAMDKGRQIKEVYCIWQNASSKHLVGAQPPHWPTWTQLWPELAK